MRYTRSLYLLLFSTVPILKLEDSTRSFTHLHLDGVKPLKIYSAFELLSDEHKNRIDSEGENPNKVEF